MIPVKHIVAHVALDRRDPATLRYAAWIAHAGGAEVVYLTNIAPTFDLPAELARTEAGEPIDEQVVAQLDALLAAEPALFPPSVRVDRLAREGVFEAELVRLAAQKSADLICLGRLRPEDADPIGDSAVNLVRKSPCSVLVVPEEAEPPPARILVPIDFSDSSRDALGAAVNLAAAVPGATLTIVHVYWVPIGYARAGLSFEQMAARMRELAEERWVEMQRGIDFRGVSWTMRYDLGTSIAGTILTAAQELDAQLIVLGSHGRTIPAAALLGHVADSVCSKTTRPFLCVKRKGQVVNLLQAILQLYDLG